MARTTTTTMRSNLQLHMSQDRRRTDELYRKSFGGVANTLSSAIGRSWTLWHVIGLANQIWEDLRPRLERYLEVNDSEIEYPTDHQGPRDLIPTLRCYMVGKDKNHASPHIACLSNYSWYSKAIKRQILESTYLEDVRWYGVLLLPGIRVPGRMGSTAQIASMPMALEDFKLYLPYDCKRLGGGRVRISSDHSIVGIATIGGVVLLDGQSYALTAGHILLKNDNTRTDSSADYSNAPEWYLDENDLDPLLLDDEDFVTSPNERESARDLQEPPTPDSSEWGLELGSSHSPWAMGCDWTLFMVRHRSGDDAYTSNMIDLSQSPEKYLFVDSIARTMVGSGTEILLSTPHSTLQGYGQASTTSLGMEGWGIFRTAWTISLDHVRDGDCGAWAVNAQSGELLGVLVAVSDLMAEAYILPIRDIWESIKRVTGKEPSLPKRGSEDELATEPLRDEQKHEYHGEEARELVKMLEPPLQKESKTEPQVGGRIARSPTYRASIYLASQMLLLSAFSDHQKLERLLKDGANVNSQDPGQGSTLYVACSVGNLKVVEILLKYGADANAQGGFYGYALQVASNHGEHKTVQALIAHGANVNLQGGAYGSALQAASARGHREIVQTLLEHGAVDTPGGVYGNALLAAKSYGREEIVQLLLDHGAGG